MLSLVPVSGYHIQSFNEYFVRTYLHVFFPGGSLVKNPPANVGDAGVTQVQTLGGEDPWRRKWQPTPVFLPGKSHRQRSLVGYSPWGRKELDMTEHNLHICSIIFWG